MFGRRWFGGAWFGAAYWGDGADVAFVPAVRKFKARASRKHFTARML